MRSLPSQILVHDRRQHRESRRSTANSQSPPFTSPYSRISTLCCVGEAMDPENKRFGSGPREVGGAVDLISQYKLWPHHEFFCKRTPPLSLLGTHYLRNVVGNTEIQRGEGMELDQLFGTTSNLKEKGAHITTFELEILREAFHMRDSSPIDLPSAVKGNLTSMELKGEFRGKKRKHRKHRDHKDKINDKDKYRSGHHDPGPKHSRKQQDLKRRHDGNGDLFDIRKHKNRQVVEEIVE